MRIHHYHIAQLCPYVTQSVQCSQMRTKKSKSNEKSNKEDDLLLTIHHSKSHSTSTPSNKIMTPQDVIIVRQSIIIILSKECRGIFILNKQAKLGELVYSITGDQNG